MANLSCTELKESSAGSQESSPHGNGFHRRSDLCSSDQGPEKKRIRLDAYPDVEECLFFWYVQGCRQSIPITGQILQEKAAEFAQLLAHEKLQFSDAWINKFKFKWGITLKKQRDDFLAKSSAGGVSETAEYAHTKHFDVTSCYPQKDIFTVIETGLLWKLLPDEKPEEWSSKILRSADGEFSEERLTLIMACNMDGTEKFPLIVIGNGDDGKHFGTAITSIKYIKNSSSWITSDIIEDWVLHLEQKMKDDGRKIALVTENSVFGAMGGRLNNVHVFLRAPHSAKYVTLQISKMVRSLKLRYRRKLLSHIQKCHKAGEDSSVSFTDSLCWLATAWLDVKPKIYTDANSLCAQDGEELELLDDCQRMIDICRQRTRIKEIESFSMESYVTVDDRMCTMDILTAQEIATVFQKSSSSSKSSDRFEEANNSSGGEKDLTQFKDESAIVRSFCVDDNLTSCDKSKSEGRMSSSKSPDRDVLSEKSISFTDGTMLTPSLRSATSDNSFTPRSSISEGGNSVELSFVVENPDSHTEPGLAFITVSQEHSTPQTRVDGENHIALQQIHAQVPDSQPESIELTEDLSVAKLGDKDHTSTLQISEERSPLLQDNCRIVDTTSECTSLETCAASSSRNVLSSCSTPPLSVHISPNREMYFGSRPTAAEAMTALMLVHSFIFSKPNAQDVVKDSFCHLVRFLSDSVVEESRPKEK